MNSFNKIFVLIFSLLVLSITSTVYAKDCFIDKTPKAAPYYGFQACLQEHNINVSNCFMKYCLNYTGPFDARSCLHNCGISKESLTLRCLDLAYKEFKRFPDCAEGDIVRIVE